MRKSHIISKIAVSLSLMFLFCSPALYALDDGQALTPPMGWNSWNCFGKTRHSDIDIKDNIDALVYTGLKDAGYEYVVIDGGWRDVKLGPNGEMLTNPTKYPKGVKWLADYAHSKGLKFGLHIVPGTADCGGDPIGAIGRESIHLSQYESWGLDFLKIDRCRGIEDKDLEDVYTAWRDLIVNSKRKILFSISAYYPYDWFPGVAHMSRTSMDVKTNIDNVISNVNAGIGLEYLAGPGAWNDPDMMETGNLESPGHNRVHMALFCVVASPLILGNDVRIMSDEVIEIMVNREAIAINQDKAGIQGTRIFYDNKKNIQVWMRVLHDGSRAVAVVNMSDEAVDYTVSWKDIGLKRGKAEVRDVWAQKSIGEYSGSFTAKNIAAEDCAFVRISGKPAGKIERPKKPFNVALGKKVTADSNPKNADLSRLVREDNRWDDYSSKTWVSDKSEGKHWLEVDLGRKYPVYGVAARCKSRNSMPFSNYRIQQWSGDKWKDITHCPENPYLIFYEEFEPVVTDKIRILTENEGISCQQIRIFANRS